MPVHTGSNFFKYKFKTGPLFFLFVGGHFFFKVFWGDFFFTSLVDHFFFTSLGTISFLLFTFAFKFILRFIGVVSGTISLMYVCKSEVSFMWGQFASCNEGMFIFLNTKFK